MARGIKLAKLPRCEVCGAAFTPKKGNANRFCSLAHSNIGKGSHGAGMIKKARALWDAGYSQAQVGYRLGLGKDMIAGIAYRNDFPKRDVPKNLLRSGGME